MHSQGLCALGPGQWAVLGEELGKGWVVRCFPVWSVIGTSRQGSAHAPHTHEAACRPQPLLGGRNKSPCLNSRFLQQKPGPLLAGLQSACMAT